MKKNQYFKESGKYWVGNSFRTTFYIYLIKVVRVLCFQPNMNFDLFHMNKRFSWKHSFSRSFIKCVKPFEMLAQSEHKLSQPELCSLIPYSILMLCHKLLYLL